jgi:hypothetical protein
MATLKNDAEYYIKDGNYNNGFYRLEDGFLIKGKIAINTSRMIYCEVVKDQHETIQSGAGRIAGGIIGGVLLGPVGAIGGLLSGGKRRVDETIIICSFSDGKSFVAESTQLGAANLSKIVDFNKRLIEDKKTSEVVSNVSLDNDVYDCPECAEVIKVKAKICRYCGVKLEPKLSDIDEARNDFDENEMRRFISDYRNEVNDYFFRNDEDIKLLINDWLKFFELSEDKNATSKIKEKIIKKYSYPSVDLDKLIYFIVSIDWIVESSFENMMSESSSAASEDGIDKILVKSIVLKYLNVRKNSPNIEYKEMTDILIRHVMFEREIIIGASPLFSIIRQIPYSFRSGPFYIFENYLIAIDPVARKKKVKTKVK